MNRFVIIDLETTGHSQELDDKIIEIGMVVIENGIITGEYSSLLNPEKKIPSFISNLTGIVDKDVVSAPKFEEKAEEIINIFHNSYLVAHNVPFDLGFLNGELSNHHMKELSNLVVDTVELARILYPQAPGYTLTQLANYLHIDHNTPHRALSDAYVTAKLLLKLKEKLMSLPYETINQLLKLEKAFSSDLDNILSKRLNEIIFSSPKNNDFISYGGIAFKQTESDTKDKSEYKESFGTFLDDVYEANGTMERKFENYEKRIGQREMSENIFDAFQMKKHALIEAGTGTGKSLAYLLPAIYESFVSNKRIVISTYTIQLQTQLLEEEIPLVQKLISLPFKVALLKGKDHYISLEKFKEELISEDLTNYDLVLSKAMILVWLTETETGDIDEIQLPSSGYNFFNGISAASKEQVDPYSPWYNFSYYHKARKLAQEANLIITNHALLCTDIFNEYKLIPSYDKAVIDEAHHLEYTASRHYGSLLNYMNMQYKLNLIGSLASGGWIKTIANKHSVLRGNGLFENWNLIYDQTKYEIDDLFTMVLQYVKNQKHKKPLSDIGKIQYRLEECEEDNPDWRTIKDMGARLTAYLNELIHMLDKIEPYLNKDIQSNKFAIDDLAGHKRILHSFIERLDLFFLDNNTKIKVNWIEVDSHGTKNDLYLYSEPLDISTLLAFDFFKKKQSIILTSATLTMRSSFSFIKNRLGLLPEHVSTKQIDSPFSYEDQVQLMVPNDFPAINNRSLDDYIYSTCEAILSLADITKGRMLVLFTSYDMLRKSYSLLRETMDTSKYHLIAQGISSGSRSRLKKNFQTFDQSILLGTSSFWEGVDIPGDDLSCIVIARLPFHPPNHPIYEAKATLLKQQGKNAFIDYSLPNAVIRFKQGFGRLIRSTKDRGIVFVCDARIINARYGTFFTKSIPKVPIKYESTHSLIKLAEKWF